MRALIVPLIILATVPLLAAEEMISTIAANWQRFCNPRNRAA